MGCWHGKSIDIRGFGSRSSLTGITFVTCFEESSACRRSTFRAGQSQPERSAGSFVLSGSCLPIPRANAFEPAVGTRPSGRSPSAHPPSRGRPQHRHGAPVPKAQHVAGVCCLFHRGGEGGGEEKEKKAGCSPTAWASMLAMLLALWIRQGGRARRAGRGNNKGSSPKLVLRPEVTHDS